MASPLQSSKGHVYPGPTLGSPSAQPQQQPATLLPPITSSWRLERVGMQEALQQDLQHAQDTLRNERLALAELRAVELRQHEAALAELRQEAEELRAVGRVHEQVASEATRRTKVSQAAQRKLQGELDSVAGSAGGGAPSPGRQAAASAPYSPGGDLWPPMDSADACCALLANDSGDVQLRSPEPSGPLRATSPGALSEPMSSYRAASPRGGGEGPLRAASRAQLLAMVQASMREVVQVQTDLGLGKQRAAELTLQVQSLASERDRLLVDGARREGDLRAASQAEAEARAEARNLEQEASRLRQDATARDLLASELRRSLCDAKVDRERLAAELARSSAELERARAAEVALAAENKAGRKLAEDLRDMLTDAQAERRAADTRAEKAAQEKRALEVEWRSYQKHFGTGESDQLRTIAGLEVQVEQLSRQQECTSNLQSYVQSIEVALASAEVERRELHNALQELKGNIRVFCRVKPGLLEADESSSLAFPEPNKLVLGMSGGSGESEVYAFAFDRVFSGDATQEGVFGEVEGLVQSALDGYKVCIFAYGQTGSGKTYTMQGTNDHRPNWGLIPRSLTKIFQESEKMRKSGWEWSLQASFMEVYNENLRDLLRGGGDSAAGPAFPVGSGAREGSGKEHAIQHHEVWGTWVTNMSCVEVNSMEQIQALMAKASKQRSVGCTDMNAVSSRSHSVFALYLRGTNQKLGSELCGALHLVDLAGSERLDKSGATGERLKETQSINKSLSSLADVFVAKAEGRSHVPFRNSRLTYLMEPCLSGQGKTLMLVNVHTDQSNAHETLCSLRFARQVSQCTTGGKPKRTARNSGIGASLQPRSASPPPRDGPGVTGDRSPPRAQSPNPIPPRAQSPREQQQDDGRPGGSSPFSPRGQMRSPQPYRSTRSTLDGRPTRVSRTTRAVS